MDEVTKLKAEVYDHMIQMELHQKAIQEKSQRVTSLQTTLPNPVVATPASTESPKP